MPFHGLITNFLVVNNNPYLYFPQFHYPFTQRRISWLLPNFDNYEKNCCKHLCEGFSVDILPPLGDYQSVIAELYGKSMFHFKTSHQTIFQRNCTIFHSYQQCVRVPAAPHLYQHWCYQYSQFWSFKQIMVSLIVCVSLMTYDVKNLFICLFATYVTYLVRYLL